MNIIQMSVAGSCLIAATLVLRALFQSRLPRWTFLLLWLAAVLRLIIPFTIPSPASVYTAAQRIPAISRRVNLIRATLPAAAPAPIEASAVAKPFPWLTALWIAGMLLCTIFFLAAHIRARSIYAQSLPASDEEIDDYIQGAGLRRKVFVRVSDRIRAPLTYGLIRPVILLPKHVGATDERYILSHELYHIRRLDVVWKTLLVMTVCLHWFNPLVWIMLAVANRDLELSCDGAVLDSCDGQSRKDYALLLLRMEERRALFNPLASGFGKSAIEERIRAIMKMKSKSVIALILAALLVITCVIAFATGAVTPKTIPERLADQELDVSNVALEEMLLAAIADAQENGGLTGNAPAQGDIPRIAQGIMEIAREKDTVKWTGMIHDKLMEDCALNSSYISDHFLVNWIYAYLTRNAQIAPDESVAIIGGADGPTKVYATVSGEDRAMYRQGSWAAGIALTDEAVRLSATVGQTLAVGDAEITIERYMCDGKVLFIEWSAKAPEPTLVTCMWSWYSSISYPNFVMADTDGARETLWIDNFDELAPNGQMDVRLWFYSAKPLTGIVASRQAEPFSDKPIFVEEGGTLYPASYMFIERTEEGEIREWDTQEADLYSMAPDEGLKWLEQNGYVESPRSAFLDLSVKEHPDTVHTRPVGEMSFDLEGMRVEIVRADFTNLYGRVEAKVYPDDVSGISQDELVHGAPGLSILCDSLVGEDMSASGGYYYDSDGGFYLYKLDVDGYTVVPDEIDIEVYPMQRFISRDAAENELLATIPIKLEKIG